MRSHQLEVRQQLVKADIASTKDTPDDTLDIAITHAWVCMALL
jgi:hypothetical protein